MCGIYIHIPYCKKACHYCDFHFSTVHKTKPDFLKALKNEIRLRREYLNNTAVNTVYFGGGTPSLLSANELHGIFDEIDKYHEIAGNAEITIEVNPDDLSIKKTKELAGLPFNRLSIGVQSFFDADLQFMNRTHNAAEAEKVIITARDAGFENISIDLIYGTQTLSNENWEQNLDKAVSLNIQHLSAYCLTIEPKTALSQFIKTGRVKDIDEQKNVEQFEILMNKMKTAGFIHYEISNFGKKNFFSKHNSSCWKQKKYAGFGPSAHSYNGVSRQWNIANNNEYINSLKNNQLRFEIETLTTSQKFNEYILTSLRTVWGCDTNYILSHFGKNYYDNMHMQANTYIKNGMLKNKKNQLILTGKGKLFADKITSALFELKT